jgi:hypothetical protein
MSGGGGSDSTETKITYADYVQNHHDAFLNQVAWYALDRKDLSPFASYEDIIVDDAFFGAGYLISSFPSLYDMYGKFMAGLDIEVLWTQLFEDTVNSPVVDALISAESDLMDDDIDANSMPRLQTGMRDINAIMASSYVVGRAIIEDARVKARAKYSAELRYRLIPVAQDRWQAHLTWNQNVVGVYAELMKFYYSAKTDVDDVNYSMAAKDALWPFTVFDFERAALGALQGAMNTKTDVAGASTAKRTISGALSGAAMGAMAYKSNPGYGAAIGAVVGGIAGALN